MSNTVFNLRKHWLALSAIAALVAIALTAGALFAANERQQPETRPLAEPSVADVAAPGPPAVAMPSEPSAERVSAHPHDGQEEIDLPPYVKEPPKHPNLASNLNRLVESASSDRQTHSEDGGSNNTAEPVLVTFYVEADHLDDVKQYLEDNGIYVRNVGEDYIEAHVPPLLLGAASEQPGVLSVDTVISPRPAQSRGNVVSQGVGLHGADAWHNAGYRGNSVKVGVIDSGFEGFSQLQGSELPSSVTARCYFETARAPSSQIADCEVDSEHGTAVAETLIDVAPDVDLYIANPHSWGDLRNAVDWMAGEGVQVINVSLGYTPDGPGDGTSPFSNSPLKTIDAAVSSGITWVNSGGNSAKRVWYGALSDPDDNDQHNFTPQDVGNGFLVEEGDRVSAFIRWDDDWGGADCDLDLLLFEGLPDGKFRWVNHDDSGLGGLNPQDGSTVSVPYERVKINDEGIATAADAGVYVLVIQNYDCAKSSPWIQLTAWIGGYLEYYSPGHHIGSPAESRNQGMMAVGASHYWDINSIASYSSRGPTMDSRIKPDITGVACGTSTTSPAAPDSRCGFGGTSASAPHVAGLAALVRQRFPSYDPAQTVRYLQENAAERGPSGADNTWGSGLAALPAPQVAPTPAPTIAPTPAPGTVTPTANITVRDGANLGEVVISWDAVPQAAFYRIGYVNMVTDYPLAKASVSGDWINAFIYVDEDARNLPVSNGRMEYTIRRLAPGVRHAFTVLTSNDVVNTVETIGGTYYWPQNPRWQFLTTR